MKHSSLIGLCLAVLLFLVVPNLFAQIELAKDYKGLYVTTTIKAAHAITASDTTQYVFVSSDVKNIILFLQADTISTSDTLNVTVQGSSDGVKWHTDTTFTELRAAGSQRIVVATPDPYLRFIEAVTGTAIRHYRSIKVFPR